MQDRVSEYLDGRYAALTAKAYKEDIHRYIVFLGGEEPNQLNAEKFLTYLSMTGNKGRSLNRHLAALKALFDYRYSQSKSDKDKLVIKSFRVTEPPIVWLEEDEQRAFLAAANDPLEKAVAYTFLGAGLRLAELLGLEEEDIDRRGYLKVFGKGERHEVVPVQNEIIEAIDEFVKKQRKGAKGKIFNISRSRVEHMVREIASRAGIKKTVTPHKLRHSFATRFLALSGKSDRALVDLKEILRHRNVNTTMKYLHLLPEDVRARMPKVLAPEGDSRNE